MRLGGAAPAVAPPVSLALGRCLRVVLATLPLVLGLGEPSQASDPSPDDLLNRFLGVWRTEALIRHLGPPLRESRTTGRAAGRRIHDGLYVEFRTTSIEPPGLTEVQIMTYDAEARLYRQWVADSDGYRHEAVGRWDPSTATLRWEGWVDGATIVIDDRWVSRDRLEWTLTRTSADGAVLQTIRGTVSR